MPTLGVTPLAGRWFTAEDSCRTPSRSRSCRGSCGSDRSAAIPAIVGQNDQVNNVRDRVVGIMPRGFDVHDQKVEIWQPLTINPGDVPEHARQSLPVPRRAAQERRDARAGARRSRSAAEAVAHARAEQARAEPDQSHRFRIDPLKEDIIGIGADGAGRAAGGGRLRAADRVREPREPADRARRLAACASTPCARRSARRAGGCSGSSSPKAWCCRSRPRASASRSRGADCRLLLAVNPDAIPRTTEITLDWRVLALHARRSRSSPGSSSASCRCSTSAATASVRR